MSKTFFKSWMARSTSVLVAGLISAATLANDYVIAGSAYNINDGRLLFRELYTPLDPERNVRVDYTTAEGEVFAQKKLNYAGEVFQPTFELTDKRNETTRYARFDGAHLVVGYTEQYSRHEKVLIDNASVVIDSGWDAFVQLNWDALMREKVVRFPRLIPEEVRTIDFEVIKLRGDKSPLYDRELGRDWLYLRMKPRKGIKTLFADPIFLAYDPRGRYLMRYQGRASINDANDYPLFVRIDYQYTQ